MTEPVVSASDATVDRFCIGCGYNLRSLPSDRCPECGLLVEASAVAPIPWEARRHLGLIRAYWRTVFETTFHPTRLSRAIAFPVDAAAARRFARITALLAAIPPGIFLLAIFALNGTAFLNLWTPAPNGGIYQSGYFVPGWETLVLWSAGAMLRCTLPIGILITFLLAAGIGRHWVRSVNNSPIRHNRAKAVAAYVFAPFAWMFIPISSAAGGYAAWSHADHSTWMLCVLSFLIASVALSILLVTYIWNLLALISAATHCGWGRLVISVTGVAMCWVLSAIVGLGCFPMLVGLIYLMIDSLRR